MTSSSWPGRFALPLALALAACSTESVNPVPVPRGPGPELPDVPAQTAAQRLTAVQYRNAVHDLFGDDIAVPTSIEPDTSLDGLVSIAASVSALSPKGVEQYEDAAFEIAAQVTAGEARRKALLPCAPKAPDDLDCARAFARALGRRAFRRPLSQAEIDSVAGLVVRAGSALGRFEDGLEFGIARLLQSPHFLYRPAQGEPDPARPGELRYTSQEMASRLSFFLWNSIPDGALLDAAEQGRLVTDEGLDAEVTRLLESPRARDGLRNFVTEWLRLDQLDALSKDPVLFTYFSPEVGPAAREETLLGFERIAFDLDTDFREIFITDHTFVNPKLASMYAVPAPTRSGFGEVVFPDNAPRLGLLGHISVLALYSHATSSSATLRGRFVRTVLLCDEIPPPPVNVNTGLPDPSPDALTLRQRLAAHNADPACAGCHGAMDPIGLGLESFDAIGRYREKENGARIDPSGELDGVRFADARELSLAVHDSPKLAPCFVRTLYRYATSSQPTADEEATLAALAWDFEGSGFRVKALMREIALAPGFRLATAPQ